jgi:hypothetical protein
MWLHLKGLWRLRRRTQRQHRQQATTYIRNPAYPAHTALLLLLLLLLLLAHPTTTLTLTLTLTTSTASITTH